MSMDLTLAQRARPMSESSGDPAPLLGIPVAHKDIFVTRGWRSTAGSKMLGSYVSPFDATVVEKPPPPAWSAGKLNCDEFAMGSSNENSAWRGAKPARSHAHSGRLIRRIGRCGRGGLCLRPRAQIPADRPAAGVRVRDHIH